MAWESRHARIPDAVGRSRLTPPWRPPAGRWHDVVDMLRRASSAVPIGILAVALIACGPGSATIPVGAQQVHVEVVGTEVRLAPATVRAGDLYVVLDTPGSSVGFVQRKASADATPGPLTDEDLERLSRGDMQGTAIGGFDDLGCSPEQRAENRGRMGPCGNAFQLVLTPGMYAFFTGDLEGRPRGSYSDRITILQVLP